MMPHLAEECWQVLGLDGLVCDTHWPKHDDALLVSNRTLLVVQVNGKKRAELDMDKGATRSTVEEACLTHENVIKFLEGKTVRKIIVVPDRLVNIVAG
jgi:leucyl-tRNA synthetase